MPAGPQIPVHAMTLDAFRRPLLWLCPALAVAAAAVATAHMDYATDPVRRNGGKWIAEHGGMALNVAIVPDRSAPCIPARPFLLASLRPGVR